MRFGLLVGLLLTPALVFAANTNFLGPLVPPCTEGGDGICQACNLVQLAQNVLRFMVALSAMAVAIMFAYAGFLYVTAASNHQHLDSAKKIFWNSLIGIVIVLCAYLLIDTVLKVLTGTNLSPLSKIQCLAVSHTGPGATQVTFTPVPEPEEQPTQQQDGTGTQTGFDSTCASGGTLADAIGKIDGTTHYNPGGGGIQGPDVDAFNGTPYTVSECKLELDNKATKCSKPITVALPQDVKFDCGVKGGDLVTWDEYSKANNLPAGTTYKLSDSYGCYWSNTSKLYDKITPCDIGRTKTGYSIDVAACAPHRDKKCYPVSDVRGYTPPVPVPGG